jgi:hypothetical protein
VTQALVAEAQHIGIHTFDDDTRAALKQEFDSSHVQAVLVLSTRYGTGKVGTFRIKMAESSQGTLPDPEEFDDWEGQMIRYYLVRDDL